MILKRRLTPRLVLDSLLFLAFVVLRFVFFLYMLLWETYRDCFHDFSFSLRFLEVSHVEGSSLTTCLRYQALLSFL